MIPVTSLPDSWEECRLGDVIDYGTTQKAEPDEIPSAAWVLELEDIEKDTSKVLRYVIFAQRRSKSTKNRFAVGDVLYGKLRPYLNKVVRADQDGYCTTEIVPLRPSEAIDGDYLFYWLKHPAFLEYVISASHGLNMPRLGTEAGKEAPFVLAPLNEQKRIADKLDAILARVDACRERLDCVPTILKRFRQAVLAAATAGKLTEDWREDQVSDNWQTVSVEAVASEAFDGPFGSNLKSKDYAGAGMRVVRLENIAWLNFIADKETFISQEKYETLRKHTLKGKDVLFSSFIAEDVRVCLLPDNLSEQAINKADCFCIRTDPIVCLPEFLALRLACQSTFLALEQDVHGATRPRINLMQLKEFTFKLPPLSEQHELVRRVESLFAYADRLEARYTVARAKVEGLTPALLAKAFRGELVPQDPNDEPASVLLERIRATRTEQPTAQRRPKSPAIRVPRTPREKTAMPKSRHDDDVQHKPYLAGLLRAAGSASSVEDLFKRAELPVTDFYKQLAWEVANGHIRDDETRLGAA